MTIFLFYVIMYTLIWWKCQPITARRLPYFKQKENLNMAKNGFFTYKGRPFVRAGNIIYYGDLGEDYVVMLQILSTEKVKDLNMAKNVSVQLQLTSPTVPAQQRIVKRTEKIGLFNAMDIADIWLTRALSESKA